MWDKEHEKYYVSVVDVVGVISNSDNPRKYWNWLKNKFKKEEDFETSSITRQLKLKAQDGKYRLTDVVDIVIIITESKDGRKYWNKLKQRLKEEGNESVTNCHQLKYLMKILN